MALIKCPDCQTEISDSALACPNCGKPSKKVRNKEIDQRQMAGCLVAILGVIACLVGTVIPFAYFFGIVFLLAGLVYIALNTRLV